MDGAELHGRLVQNPTRCDPDSLYESMGAVKAGNSKTTFFSPVLLWFPDIDQHPLSEFGPSKSFWRKDRLRKN